MRSCALLVAIAALGLTACQHTASEDPKPGLAFAQAACGGCHEVERNGVSPNPASPPFAAIVNRDGVTRETLTTFLRDAHNYPEEMDFTLGPKEVEGLVDYMLTLRDPNYHPPI